MSEEEKYDELIRQKFAEKEFMFNEANWERAEAMIDSSRKTKKIFWWSAIFLIGLITGIFLMLPLIKNNSLQVSNDQAKSNDALIANGLSNESQRDKTRAAEKLTSDNNSSLNGSTKNKSTSTAVPENKLSTMSRELPDSKGVEHRVKTNTIITPAQSNKKNKHGSETDQGSSHSMQAGTQSLTPQKKKEENNKTSRTKKDVYALAYERNVVKNAKPHLEKKSDDVKKEVKAEDTKNETKEGKFEEDAEKKKLPKEGPATHPIDSTITENNAAEEVAAKIDALNDSVKQEEKKLAAADSIQKSDSTKIAAQDKSITPALDGLANATFFSIDAGINGHLGWKNNDAIEGRGITPVLGFGVTHAFNQTWSISSGVHYNGIGYLKGDSKTARTTTYDFGSTTTVTTTKPHFLHYIAIPVIVQYHFNEKNAVMVGGSFAYLLNAKSKVEEYITYVRPVDTVSSQNSSDHNYDAKTFNMFDAVISVGYRRKISSRFSIAAIANFGLLDIKPKPFFLNNTIERNSGLKVILSYTIFDY